MASRIPPFKQLKLPNDTYERMQNNIAQVFDALGRLEILNGRLIENIDLTSAETPVEHRLGRAYRGWIVVNKNAAQDVYVSSTALNELFINLTAGGDGTISLWGF